MDSKKSKLTNCVQCSNCHVLAYDLESVGIGPRANGPFEERGKILERGKFVVLRIGGKIVGISTNSPL